MSDTARAVRFPGGWWWLTLPLWASAWVRELWAPDEPYFAEGAREMLVDGEWVPTFPNARYLLAKKEFEYWDEAEAEELTSEDLVRSIFDHVEVP